MKIEAFTLVFTGEDLADLKHLAKCERKTPTELLRYLWQREREHCLLGYTPREDDDV